VTIVHKFVKIKEGPGGKGMSEIEEAKQKFFETVASIDRDVKCVIPERPTDFNFLISFEKRGGKKFITFSEDDLLDLLEGVRVEEIKERITETISQL